MSAEDLPAWLHLLSSVGRAGARRLLARHGSPQAVFREGARGWSDLVTEEQAALLAQAPEHLPTLVQRTEDWLDGGERRGLMFIGEADYPAALLHTADPPLMLYLDGRRELLAQRCIAVVGSRKPSRQGLENARHFADGLGHAGFCVVSGLALGIDGAAHEGALNTPGCTVAVLGSGLDHIYPLEHEALAIHIARRGLLMSEYFVGTPPLGPNFPQRNRIIAGLSEGCLVVEAALKSGSLITARMASEAGREVFAVPGPIQSSQSRGCHHLLKQGACLVQDLDDLLAELPPAAPPPAGTGTLDLLPPTAFVPAVDPDALPESAVEHPLLRALGPDTITLEELSQRSGWPLDQLNAGLLDLELEGRLTRLPGALFQRRVAA